MPTIDPHAGYAPALPVCDHEPAPVATGLQPAPVPWSALHPLARVRAVRALAIRTAGVDRAARECLTVLALRTDEHGCAAVGQDRIALESGFSVRTVRDRLAMLARAGLMTRRREGARGLYRYQLAAVTLADVDGPTAARLTAPPAPPERAGAPTVRPAPAAPPARPGPVFAGGRRPAPVGGAGEVRPARHVAGEGIQPKVEPPQTEGGESSVTFESIKRTLDATSRGKLPAALGPERARALECLAIAHSITLARFEALGRWYGDGPGADGLRFTPSLAWLCDGDASRLLERLERAWTWHEQRVRRTADDARRLADLRRAPTGARVSADDVKALRARLAGGLAATG